MFYDQMETGTYRGPCGVAYATPCTGNGTWYVHYEDKGRGHGRRMGCGLTSDEARRLAHRLAWGPDLEPEVERCLSLNEARGWGR